MTTKKETRLILNATKDNNIADIFDDCFIDNTLRKNDWLKKQFIKAFSQGKAKHEYNETKTGIKFTFPVETKNGKKVFTKWFPSFLFIAEDEAKEEKAKEEVINY